MPTIIDGYNLIFAMGWEGKSTSGRSLERARRRLLSTLSQRLNESDRAATTIVFDAKKLPIRETSADSVVDGMRVIFAIDQPDADTLIEQLIQQHSTPKQLTVVSSDHRLHKAARRRKAKPVDSDVWLDGLSTQAAATAPNNDPTEANPKQAAINSLEATDWAKEFGLSDSGAKPAANAERDQGDAAETFNPFPPGYGEDLLE